MSYQFPELWGRVDHAIVHAAATPPSLDVGASWLDRIHRQKGWSMCGYHIVIRRDGSVEWSGLGSRTRPWGRTGSHVGGCGAGWNERSIGICLIGGVKEDNRTPDNNFTVAQKASLRAVLDELVSLGIPQQNVMGHRDLIKQTNAAPKACPCFSVREWYVIDGDRFGGGFKWFREVSGGYGRGDKLKTPRVYTVREGDNLWQVSRTFGVDLDELKRMNNIHSEIIHAGQKLKLWTN